MTNSMGLSNRIRPLPSLTLEAGARRDQSTQTGDGRLDPRLNLAWQPREGITIRGAWGRTSQAQPLQSLHAVVSLRKPQSASVLHSPRLRQRALVMSAAVLTH